MPKFRAKLEGGNRLRRRLSANRSLAKGGDVIVGYTASYALPVHENVGANFKTAGTQAKFLEAPFRRMIKELLTTAKTAMKGGASFIQSLFIAGLRLQRESQKIVPVDTGNLRASAFTRIEK